MKGLLMRLLLIVALMLVSFSTRATPVFGQISPQQPSLAIVHFKQGSTHSISGPACSVVVDAQKFLELTNAHIPNNEDAAAMQHYILDPRFSCKSILYEKMIIGDTVIPPNAAGIGIISLWPEDSPNKVWYLIGNVTTDPAGK